VTRIENFAVQIEGNYMTEIRNTHGQCEKSIRKFGKKIHSKYGCVIDVHWIQLAHSGGPVANSCEQGCEPTCFIQGKEFLISSRAFIGF
jgi:hypothetical protein